MPRAATLTHALHAPLGVAADRRRIARADVVRQLPLVVTVGAALVIGVVERVWYLQHDPINSDEALVGILARHLLAGHANAFLLGQPYGGVEPYVVAATFGIFGSSSLTLQLPVVVLDAAACVLVWRAGRRLVRRRAIALVAAAAMWAAPQSGLPRLVGMSACLQVADQGRRLPRAANP